MLVRRLVRVRGCAMYDSVRLRLALSRAVCPVCPGMYSEYP